jgi:glyoxylate reductase
MKPKVYITRRIPEHILAMIELKCKVRMWQEENVAVPREVLEKEIADMWRLRCC